MGIIEKLKKRICQMPSKKFKKKPKNDDRNLFTDDNWETEKWGISL